MDNKDNGDSRKSRLEILRELARDAQDMGGYSTTGDVCLNMWTDDGVMDFVNWYLGFCNAGDHYQLESKVVLEVYRQQKTAGHKIRAHAENLSDIVLETPRSYNEEIVLSNNIEKYLRENREALIRDLEFLKS